MSRPKLFIYHVRHNAGTVTEAHHTCAERWKPSPVHFSHLLSTI